jgi:uncharacterized protein (DUF1778 family)
MTAMLDRPARSQKRQRPAVAAARLTDTEMQQVRNAADAVGMSVSDYVRSVVLEALLNGEPVVS